jgi:hypothetical protein
LRQVYFLEIQEFPQAFPFLQIRQHCATTMGDDDPELGAGVNCNVLRVGSALISVGVNVGSVIWHISIEASGGFISAAIRVLPTPA